MDQQSLREPPLPRSGRWPGAAYVIIGVLVLGPTIANGRGSPLTTTVVVLLYTAALFLCGRQPFAALVLAVIAAAILPNDRALILPVMASLYELAGQTTRPKLILSATLAIAAMIVAGAGWGGHPISRYGGLAQYAIATAAACAAAVGLGLYMASATWLRSALQDRAERLERERELLTQRALTEERVRIAHELHDVIAHTVSLMVVEAQALGATVHDENVERSTTAIAELGREAMGQMHTTVRLLRSEVSLEDGLAPQPGLAQVGTLIKNSRAAGLSIELIVTGEPRELSQDVGLSAYRIVQEALTNVIKHADATKVTVMIEYQPRQLAITVRDIGRPAAMSSARPQAGNGLIGMRERTAMIGGELVVESLDDGFQVKATLPAAERGR